MLNIELFDKQLEVKAAASAAKRIVLEVGRRGGKTDFMCEVICNDLVNLPKANLLYIAKSGESAKNIVWAKLMKILTNKPGIKTNEHNLEIVSRNGARLKVAGGDKEPDSFRGPAYHKVFIDEAAFIRDLKYLVQEVIEPALIDYDGSLFIASTPFGFGDFYGFCHSREGYGKWSYFHWTAYDNPYIRSSALDKVKDQYGESSDIWIQEYMAQPVRHAGLIFQNLRPYPPHVIPVKIDLNGRRAILGIDPGTKAPNGFVLALYDHLKDELCVVRAQNKKCDIEKLALAIKKECEQYPGLTVIVDGHATHVIQELGGRYGLPVVAWTKKDIIGSYQRLITRLNKVSLKINDNDSTDLLNEMLEAEWRPTRDPNDENGQVLGSDHCIDALRYINEYLHFKEIANPVIPDDGLDEQEKKLIGKMKKDKEEKEWEI